MDGKLLRYIRLTLVLGAVLIVFPSPVVAATANTNAAAIPFKPESNDVEQLAAKVIGSLVLVSLLGLGIIYALKRYLPTGFRIDPAKGQRVVFIESIRLNPKTTIYLFELDGSPLLIAQSSENIVSLSTPTDPCEIVRAK